MGTHLSALGCVVTLIADQRSDATQAVYDAQQQFTVKRVALQQPRWPMYFKRLSLLFKLAKEQDLVIASGKFALWAVALLRLRYNRKMFAVIHGSEVNFKSPVLKYSIRLALRHFDTLIAVSRHTASFVSPYHPKVVVIPNGFDPQKWSGVMAEKAFRGLPYTDNRWQYNRTQRPGQCGGAVTRAAQGISVAALPLRGHSYRKDTLIALAESLGVTQSLTVHGRLPDHAVQALLQQSDVFVMLSTTTRTGDVEGFGIAVLEANALGLPAIGSLHSGLEDAISNQQSGCLIVAQDTQAFIKALKTIKADYHDYSAHAIAWAQQHHWAQTFKAYHTLMLS